MFFFCDTRARNIFHCHALNKKVSYEMVIHQEGPACKHFHKVTGLVQVHFADTLQRDKIKPPTVLEVSIWVKCSRERLNSISCYEVAASLFLMGFIHEL